MMQLRFKYLLLLLMMMWIPSAIFFGQGPQSLRTLKGTVQDPTGAVIAEAQVVLTSRDGQVVSQSVTTKSGDFSFVVAVGSYAVQVTKPGFKDVHQPVEVGAGTRSAISVVLPIASVKEQVDVTASDTSGPTPSETLRLAKSSLWIMGQR